MRQWLQQLLPRALDLALARPRAVPTTRMGLLDSVLSHLAPGCSSARHFASCLARGLLANTAPQARTELLGELCRWGWARVEATCICLLHMQLLLEHLV